MNMKLFRLSKLLLIILATAGTAHGSKAKENSIVCIGEKFTDISSNNNEGQYIFSKSYRSDDRDILIFDNLKKVPVVYKKCKGDLHNCKSKKFKLEQFKQEENILTLNNIKMDTLFSFNLLSKTYIYLYNGSLSYGKCRSEGKLL